MMNPEKPVVILGSGVIGLTIAHVLSEDPSYKIRIIARDHVENLDSQAWASPWAGANWFPMSEYSERTYKWEKRTFDKLWSMIPTGRVLELPARITQITEDVLTNIWYKDLVHNLQIHPAQSDGKCDLTFTTISTKPGIYLPWLKSELVSRGVEFYHKFVGSLEEAAACGHPGAIVVNATGLGAKSLLGVEDQDLYPIRGQTIQVRAPHVKEYVGEWTDKYLAGAEAESVMYIIPRTDGTVILGGTYQANDWDTSVNHDTARAIFKRCCDVNPALSNATVLSHNVGLRPARRGGARVEVEIVQLPLTGALVPHVSAAVAPKELKVVHAYGFGGAGYQSSWGAAEEAAQLVRGLFD